ncbi:MAG TPA: hypothetical protein VHQ20_02145, partial [Patescibacteria group bacterium]|nr:hypothetical protein [Patescibacteria group bacterium]
MTTPNRYHILALIFAAIIVAGVFAFFLFSKNSKFSFKNKHQIAKADVQVQPKAPATENDEQLVKPEDVAPQKPSNLAIANGKAIHVP